MSNPVILAEAEFTRKVCTYWLLSGAVIMLCSVVGIPLIPFWFIVGLMITGKFLERMSCTLTEKTLIVRKGLFNRIEKTIPLEKITDLALRQGPIMRALDLWGLSIETAGSSGGDGALVAVIGIVDTKGFRDRVLAQRDALTAGQAAREAVEPIAGGPSVLEDIRDTLHRIESGMNRP